MDNFANLPASENMTPSERKAEIESLSARLKALRATPRSDWHREFEDILQLDVDSWKTNSWIDTEVTIGEDAPRTDFIIVNNDVLPDSVKSIFRHFRRHNVIEYKGPGEAITRRMIWKTAGYGCLLIGTTKETQYREDELTLTMFAARKIGTIDMLAATDTHGIYQVSGFTALPFYVVITDELEGKEYAPYRALTDHAEPSDVETILSVFKTIETGEAKDRYHRILQLIEVKNPGIVAKLIEGDAEMESVFMKVLEPQVNERIAEARAEERDAMTERLIDLGSDGVTISKVTGYDRTRIDRIAARTNRIVSWGDSRE